MHYTAMDFDEIIYFTQAFLSLNSTIVQSSTSLTEGNELAVNEVFEVLIECAVPLGLTDIILSSG